MKILSRFLSMLLAVCIAGVLVGFGCGGSSQFETGPDDSTGEGSIHVKLSISGVVEGGYEPTISKDVGGIGYIDFGPGDIRSPEDWGIVTCWFEFEPLTKFGYEVVSNIGDCINPSECLECTTSWDDPQQTRCHGNCEGVIPEGAVNDVVYLSAMFESYFKSDMEDTSLAAFRQDGCVANFPEMDISQIVAPFAYPTHYETLDCDGSPDMSMDLTDPIGIDGVNTNCVGGGKSVSKGSTPPPLNDCCWRKGFSLLASDSTPDPQDGLGECRWKLMMPARIEFAISGPSVNELDLSRGPIVVKSRLCDDFVNYCPELGVNGEVFFLGNLLYDSSGVILDGQTAAMISPIKFNSNTTMEEFALHRYNFDVQSSSLGVGQAQPVVGATMLDPLDAADGRVKDDWFIMIDDVSDYQLQDLQISAVNLVLAVNSYFPNQLVNFIAGCAMNDNFFKNSATPIECWDPSVVYSFFFPSTLTTWDQIDERGESALVFDLANNMLIYRDSNKGDDIEQVVKISKQIYEPSGSWQLEAKSSNTGGFKALEGGVGVDALAYNVMTDNSTGYTIGLQTVDIGGVLTQTCYALYMLNGSPQGGSYMSCEFGDVGGEVGTDFIFRLTADSVSVPPSMTAEVSFDEGATWHDIVVEGVIWPTAGHEYLDYASLTGNVYGSIVTMSADDGTTKNNTADIEYVRFPGLSGPNHYSEIPVGISFEDWMGGSF